VERSVNEGLGRLEADLGVVGGDHGLGQLVEDLRLVPLVTPGPQCGVGHDPAGQALGVDPAAAGDEPHEHGEQADPVRDPPAVTPERMVVDRGWEQGLNFSPDGIEHLGVERAHDVGDLHWIVGLECTRHPSWAITATGGWSQSNTYPRGL
jgi:hypothetical protein